MEGAYVATGHSVWGVLNGPATGEALAELIVERAAHSSDLRPFDPSRLRPLLPRLAWSVGLIAALLLVWQRYEVAQHERLVAGVALVLQAATLPEPQNVMQDFEVIQQLDQLPPARDLELLTALSQ